eukprot:m.131997 g.131997  ORF g.131997 m.131997 type:complete len:673 (-) comp13928_c0_seq3:218-2236(-)
MELVWVLLNLVGAVSYAVFTTTFLAILQASSFIKRIWFKLGVWEKNVHGQELTMKQCTNLAEYQRQARKLDSMRANIVMWKKEVASPMYEYTIILHRRDRLRTYRRARKTKALVAEVRENLSNRFLGGLNNEELYMHCAIGTKDLIESYNTEVKKALKYIADCSEMSLEKKKNLFSDISIAYGRTALMLSGGLGSGMYHWGVIKCLLEAQLLPPVICGANVGAFFTAVLGLCTDEDLTEMFTSTSSVDFSAFERQEQLQHGVFHRRLVRFLTRFVVMDAKIFEQFCKDNFSDMTFAEAYRRSNRPISITLTHTARKEYPTILNHITTPDVLLWSAVAASCAQPLVFEPVSLMVKDSHGNISPYIGEEVSHTWAEVHLRSNLPMEQLRQQFRVNHFIVSQVNGHAIPVIRTLQSTSRKHFLHRMLMRFGQEFAFYLRLTAELFHSTSMLRLLEPIKGDVTITPHISTTYLANSMQRIDHVSLARHTELGQQAAFRFVSMIETKCGIERSLQSHLRSIVAQSAESQVPTPTARSRTGTPTRVSSPLPTPPMLSPARRRSPNHRPRAPHQFSSTSLTESVSASLQRFLHTSPTSSSSSLPSSFNTSTDTSTSSSAPVPPSTCLHSPKPSYSQAQMLQLLKTPAAGLSFRSPTANPRSSFSIHTPGADVEELDTVE